MAAIEIGWTPAPEVTLAGADCLKETVRITTACNAYAGDALTHGLIIGALVGMTGLYLGLWYRGRKK
jgi:hypothetical protein